jgi:hypothetical protein
MVCKPKAAKSAHGSASIENRLHLQVWLAGEDKDGNRYVIVDAL